MGKFLDLGIIEKLVEDLKAQGKSIATTNGCFDIFHVGHFDYLTSAKSYADVLIVGINTDSSVRKIKGPLRPINNQDDRAKLIAALNCVDYVFLFDESTPDSFLRKIKPDIHIKGGDYSENNLPEALTAKEIGAKLSFIPLTEGHSTTDIIKKIVMAYRND